MQVTLLCGRGQPPLHALPVATGLWPVRQTRLFHENWTAHRAVATTGRARLEARVEATGVQRLSAAASFADMS
jgi:hypothetical protein